jgi:nucleoid-associated protein YgaU
MSTLEKFGILVILILVVIIGVVAVWGVGGNEGPNPFTEGDPSGTVASGDPAAPGDGTTAATGEQPWPGDGSVPPASGDPVAPPALGSGVTPPASVQEMAKAPPAGASTYRVQKGDTLAKISQATLGDANRWQDIVAANPGLNPKRLKIDMVLQIPTRGGTSVAGAPTKAPKKDAPGPNSFAPNPEGGPSPDPAAKVPAPATDSGIREVEVRSGDTYYKLALQYLGNSDFHYKIAQANPGIDPRKLRPGMKIKIPAN